MKTLLPLILLFFCFQSSAQNVPHTEQCAHDQQLLEVMQLEPEAFALHQYAQQNAIAARHVEEAYRATDPTESCPDGIRIIPVYFHILHDNGNPNVGGDNNFTVAELQSAVDQLNMHYAGTNPQLSRVQDQFWAEGAVSSNTCIQFCWNPTDIDRVDVSVAPHSVNLFDSSGVTMPTIQNFTDHTASPYQNRCQYLNVFTGRYGVGLNGGGLLAYANNVFYSNAGVRLDDNIVVPGGPITNPADSRGVAFAHEVGHFLGLAHIWGQSNIANFGALTSATFCGIDDGMEDTPNQGRPSTGPGGVAGGVPVYAQNYSMIHCGDTIMWTNMMDYSSNAWTVNFTNDQAAHMRLFLEQAENLLPAGGGCDTTGGFLNGENRCTGVAIGCDAALINPQVDTIRICGTDTVNLNQYIQNWGILAKGPTTEYSWRLGTLSGSLVDFPAKAIVSGNSPICTPDTLNYFLNMKCSLDGGETLGGKVVILAYRTPQQLLGQYLKDGDCEYGPGPVFSATDSAAGCPTLMTFTPQTNPTFPTTVSGEIVYDATFDSLIVGPCCGFPCSATDTASYRCTFTGGDCDGVAWSGGNMGVLSPCPDLDFEDVFLTFENDLTSVFDPNGYINDFYYFSDPERTTAFDENTDYVYNGDPCGFGEDILIHPSMGCDTDGNDIPNGYITLGTITLSDPVPFPQAPTITYSLNGDMDCVYEAVPACPLDDITPSIPLAVCGTSDIPDVTLSVLSFYDCEAEYVVSIPDCPDCSGSGGCVSSTWPGGSESVCSGQYLADGFPVIDLEGYDNPLENVVWANGPLGDPFTQLFSGEPDDLPGYSGPQLNTELETGLPGVQVFFAYSLCDEDGDPETPATLIPLGGYEVTVEPVPNALMTPICDGVDTLNFYVEVNLLTNAQSNTFTATNDYDAGTLTFSDPATQYLGPFPNGEDVTVDFAIDGGCSSTRTFSIGCLSTSCTTPELVYSDTCVLNPNNNEVEYYIDASITGNTTSDLIRLTNDLNDDTVLVSMQNPNVSLGPFSTPQTTTYTATDYANSNCSETTVVEFGTCQLVGLRSANEMDVSVYPNPANQTITFEFESMTIADGLQIKVFDVLGQVVYVRSANPIGNKLEISLNALNEGIYLAEFSSAKGTPPSVVKFVKE